MELDVCADRLSDQVSNRAKSPPELRLAAHAWLWLCRTCANLLSFLADSLLNVHNDGDDSLSFGCVRQFLFVNVRGTRRRSSTSWATYGRKRPSVVRPRQARIHTATDDGRISFGPCQKKKTKIHIHTNIKISVCEYIHMDTYINYIHMYIGVNQFNSALPTVTVVSLLHTLLIFFFFFLFRQLIWIKNQH